MPCCWRLWTARADALCISRQLKPRVPGDLGLRALPLPGLCVPPCWSRLQGKSPDFSSWLSLPLFDARVPFPDWEDCGQPWPFGSWLRPQQARGPKADVCSPDLCSLGSGMGAWLCCQLHLLPSFRPRFLLAGEGRLGHRECPSSAGLRQQHEPSPGVPRLCPHFGGAGLIRATRVHGQQGRPVRLSPQRVLWVAWRLWLGSPLRGSNASFPGLCLFSSPWGTGPSKKVPGQSASLWHPARFFLKCPLPALASQRGPHFLQLGTMLCFSSPRS